MVKGKLLVLVLPEEVQPDAADAQRSKITGALVITMPKACQKPVMGQKEEEYVVGLRGCLSATPSILPASSLLMPAASSIMHAT